MVGEALFPGGNGTSIVMGLGQMILNGEMVDMFMSNGYLVMKSANNTLFLVFDPETGILMDIMLLNSTFSGSSCYSDQQAEWVFDQGEQLLNGLHVWLKSTTEISMALSASVLAGLNVIEGAGITIGGIELAAICPPFLVIVAGALVGYVIFEYCVDQGWLPPERCREICGNAFLVPFGVINMLVYNEKPSMLEKFEETSGEVLYLLDNNKYNPAIRFPAAFYDKNEDDRPVNIGDVPTPKDGDKAKYIIDLYRDSIKNVKEGAAKFQVGNVKGGTVQFLWGVVEFHMASTYLFSSVVAKELLPK